MKLSEVDPDDPRWSFEASAVFRALYAKADSYIAQNRNKEAHGVWSCIIIVANVLNECDNRVTEHGGI